MAPEPPSSRETEAPASPGCANALPCLRGPRTERRRHSHGRQGAVFLGLLLLPGVAEVQSGLVHAEQLADPVPAVEVPVLVHDLRAGEAPAGP